MRLIIRRFKRILRRNRNLFILLAIVLLIQGRNPVLIHDNQYVPTILWGIVIVLGLLFCGVAVKTRMKPRVFNRADLFHIRRLEFLSHTDLQDLIPSRDATLLIVTDSESSDVDVKAGWNSVLYLTFDDIDSPVSGKVLFNQSQAKQLIAHVDALDKSILRVVVSCRYGRSRSSAIAKFLEQHLCVRALPEQHTLFNEQVFRCLNGELARMRGVVYQILERVGVRAF